MVDSVKKGRTVLKKYESSDCYIYWYGHYKEQLLYYSCFTHVQAQYFALYAMHT